MNEKIKEFAGQAGFIVNNDKICTMKQDNTIEFEKFAELIVDECLSVCAVDSDEGSLDYKRGVIFAMNRCQKNILNHFGVK